MTAVEHNEQLNEALIRLARCLLQYSEDAWPWIGADSDEVRGRIAGLAARQKEHVADLVDLLDRRDWSIDLGSYPDEFTDLNYVSLDFFLEKLVGDQKRLVGAIETHLAAVRDDAQGAALLERILADERAALSQLEALASARSRETPAVQPG